MTTNGTARNAFPGMRAFVFGQEITDDLLSCTVNWADDTRAPSTATFVLSNKPGADDTSQGTSRYTIDESDIFALYPNDLKPVDILLPDVRPVLANDPSLEALRIATLIAETGAAQRDVFQAFAALGRTAAEAQQLVEQSDAVTKKFATEVYNKTVESAAADIRTQIRQRVTSIADRIKRRVLLAKFDKVQPVSQPDLTETGKKTIDDARRATFLKGQAFRYPFFAGSTIFHSNDPVRIFFRDAMNPRFWFHMFAGFITDWTVTRGTEGDVTVSFVCEDVLRPLRYGRITANPGIFDIASLQEDEDFVVRTFFNDDFTRLSLTELLYSIIFGPEVPGLTDTLESQGNLDPQTAKHIRGSAGRKYVRYSAKGGVTETTIPAFGCGAFSFDRSITFVFGEASGPGDGEDLLNKKLYDREVRLVGEDALAVYQAVVDHQVRVSDLDTLLLDGETPTPRGGLAPFDPATGEPSIESVITEIGENPDRYPVDGGRLIILMPASLGPGTSRSILSRDIRGLETQTTFKNRLFILLNALQRIEFSFYASPRGDVLVEMPLYDFSPEHFGDSPVSYARVHDATKGFASTATKRLRESAARSPIGPFAPHYVLTKQDMMDSNQTFTDEKMCTQFRTTWQNIQNLEGTQTAEVIGLKPAVVTLRALVPQFGLRIEKAEPEVFIASPEAAEVYCHLKLNKNNAEALTSQVDMIPQLRLGPNRPLEVSEVPYIATIRSIARTISWDGADCSQTVGVNYTRVWDGAVDKEKNNRPLYTTIGGAAGRPLNYAALFKVQVPEESGKPRRSGDLLPDTSRGGGNIG